MVAWITSCKRMVVGDASWMVPGIGEKEQQLVATYIGDIRTTKKFPRSVYSRPIAW